VKIKHIKIQLIFTGSLKPVSQLVNFSVNAIKYHKSGAIWHPTMYLKANFFETNCNFEAVKIEVV
jgi:hypothetical protein